MTKKCKKCNKVKALDEFNKNIKTKDRLTVWCKICKNAKNKADRERNVRTNPRKPYVNQTRPSIYENAIEVKMYGNNDLWTILDLEDFERFHDYKFYVIKGYAYVIPDVKNIRLHKLIVDHLVVDHINQNKLDNRKANLRSATHSQNQINQSKRSDNTSGYKGVYWNKQKQKWVAQIKFNGRNKTLGQFNDIIEAAKVYDKAATELFGDFAVLNFPSEEIL